MKKSKKSKPKSKSKYKRPSWDDYFLSVADAIALRGTCNRGRSGAVIVKDNQVLAAGYVASPRGFPHCDDVGHQIKKTTHEDGSVTQHCVRTVHAEQNAIIQAARNGVSTVGSTVFVKMTPCRVCAMLLINSGVNKIVCAKKYHTGEESEKMFKKAKIKIVFKNKEIEKYKDM
jgi:dCMP deaminase